MLKIVFGREVLENARKYIGTSYAEHATFHSDNFVDNGKKRVHLEHSRETGLDCSGLVNIAIAQALKSQGRDMKVPRHVKEFYRWQLAKSVSCEKLKAGDLLFIHTSDKRNPPDHIGIYAGRQKVIHSTRKEGCVNEVKLKEFTENARVMPKMGIIAAKRLVE